MLEGRFSSKILRSVGNDRENDARNTTVIKAAKVVLQLFIIHSFSVRNSQRKLHHESYRAQEYEYKLSNHSALWLIKGKHMVTNEIRELNYTVL